ncbi:uncharacterized protein LOC143821700 [Paroedura picta]|uniref:uncharacterized protein LOC143821700 n=1 Tax=Paroedura picta TaxID=143630 RepID=UPI004055BDBA
MAPTGEEYDPDSGENRDFSTGEEECRNNEASSFTQWVKMAATRANAQEQRASSAEGAAPPSEENAKLHHLIQTEGATPSAGEDTELQDNAQPEGATQEADETAPPAVRRSKRQNKGIPAKRYTCQVKAPDECEPSTWEKMMNLPMNERIKWLDAVDEELDSLRG